MPNSLAVSALIPTLNRSKVLARMLDSVMRQSVLPSELIIVDASTNADTEKVCQIFTADSGIKTIYRKAVEMGAAAQRNQAMIYASQDVIWLLEDDIILETDCLAELWKAMQSDKLVGGVSSMITNQRYISPGRVSRLLFRSLHGRTEASYAGKCIGPALNLLPEDRDDLPTVVPVEWLNAGCTLYRREALPHPMFSDNFKGYSLMEDLALSLRVGQHWKLANARLARIYHDSQSADYKSNQAALAKMELINRHYVMTKVLGRNHVGYYLKLAFLEAFGVITPLTSLRAWAALPSVLLGKIKGVSALLFSKNTL